MTRIAAAASDRDVAIAGPTLAPRAIEAGLVAFRYAAHA